METASHMDFGELVSNLPAGVYCVNNKGKFEYCNEDAARIFGYESLEKMKEVSFIDLCKDARDYQALTEELGKNGEVKNHPLQMKRKDGGIITISVSCRLLRNNEGDIAGGGTFTDITEQEKFRQLLEQLLGIYQVKQREGKQIITYCNKTFAKMFGYSAEELVGSDIHDLFANKDDVYRFEKELTENDMIGKPVCAYPLEVVTKDKRQ